MSWPKQHDVLYCHLPKCAGTTVVHYIGAIRRGYAIQWGNVEASFNNYLNTSVNGRFVYGHFRHKQMQALEASGRQYKMFTFLRDPIDRLVSAYRYTISPASPNHMEFASRYPTFEDYAEWYPANDICDWLVGGANSVEEYIQKLDARFDFIGTQEYFDADMSRLMWLLGGIYKPGLRKNISQGPQLEAQPNLRAMLAEKHSLDVEAHKQIIKRYDKIHRAGVEE